MALRTASKADVADESLVFFSLPPRHSVSCADEAPRLSYYNSKLSVPFKWEATPGKPMEESSSGEGSPECARLRPPPAGLNGKNLSRSDFDEFFDVEPSVRMQSSRNQRSRLPPKRRSFSKPANFFRYSSRNSVGNDSKRSEFDWPEVSDSEYAEDDAAAELAKEEQEQNGGSFSSSSFASTSSSSAVSGGGSARHNVLLRNLMLTAGTAKHSDDDDDVPAGKGFLSCMPLIFPRGRMIQLQMRKSRTPAIDFTSRLSPDPKSIANRH